MRLLLFEPAPHGGLLHFIVQLGDALAARGHTVELLTARDNEVADRARHARMRAELPRVLEGPESPPTGVSYRLRQARIAFRLGRCWQRLLAESRSGGHDALITGADMGLVLSAAAGLTLTAIPGRPVLVRISHNVRTYNRWGGEGLYRESRVLEALIRLAHPRFDLTTFPGEHSRAEFESHRPRSTSVIMPHGDERIFGQEPPPPGEEERILFFGEWRKVKGLPLLMDAFDELVARRPTARLTIAGSPFASDLDPAPVRRWAAAHGDSVEVIDHYVPLDEVAEVFARARVVVTPYLAAAQSGVVALAMTMARAVVTSDLGELGNVVGDRQGGRVVPPGDPQALAAALEEVLADPELAARYGAEGRRRGVEGAGWEHAAERLEHALVPLVEARRTAGAPAS